MSKNQSIYTRKVDKLNRICIPIDACRRFGLKNNSLCEIELTEDSIVIKKIPDKVCTFCGSKDAEFEFKGKCICKNCVELLKK